MTHFINQRSRIRATLAAMLLAAAVAISATTFGARPAEAALPGQNGKIVYESLDLNTWNNEVFVMGSDGSDPTNLTNNTVYDAAPNWSPDGSKIAFSSQRDGGDNEVIVMASDGSDQVNLTDNENDDYDPAYSPDGNRIAFSSNREEDDEIHTINAVDGSSATRLTDGPTLSLDPDWQPLLDTAPPTVSRATPTGKAVKRDALLTATFSEAMDETTITKSSFKLFKVAAGKTKQITNVAVSLSANGLKAELDPFGASSKKLRAGTRYKAVVTTEARDVAGNRMVQSKVWSFTTGSK